VEILALSKAVLGRKPEHTPYKSVLDLTLHWRDGLLGHHVLEEYVRIFEQKQRRLKAKAPF